MQCQGVTALGAPCKNKTLTGGYCHVHAKKPRKSMNVRKYIVSDGTERFSFVFPYKKPGRSKYFTSQDIYVDLKRNSVFVLRDLADAVDIPHRSFKKADLVRVLTPIWGKLLA